MTNDANRAYEASAEALKQNLLAYTAELLGLDPSVERVFADSDHPYCVRIDPGIGKSFPLINVSLKEWRRRGPGSTIEVMTRAIARLALARVWRRHKTVAPPYGLLVTNGLGKALVERAGIDPQAYFDATWTPVEMGDKYADTADWMSAGPAPTLMARAPAVNRPVKVLPPRLPWMSGYNTEDAVFVETAEFDERLVLHWRPQKSNESELRIPSGYPLSILNAAMGKPLKTLVSHPLLNRHDLRIDYVYIHQRSARMQLRGGSRLWSRVRLKGGNDARENLREEKRALQIGRRNLEELITRFLTLPARKGDVEVNWEGILLDEEIDSFTGKPWPERQVFEGISTRRHHEEYRHIDADPIIYFDEDDPEAYPG